LSTLVAIALGLGLATAAGLRVFVPLFGAGLAAHFGQIELSPGFAWLGEAPALIAFGTAMTLEIVAYYVPLLDNALDAIATPAAVAAGIVASAAVLTDMPPVIRWGVAIIGGGGLSAITQALSVGTRIKSTLTTGGMANPVVSTAETAGSAAIVVLALLVPVLGLLVLVTLVVLAFRWVGKLTWRRGAA
jgi:hypothetical protein